VCHLNQAVTAFFNEVLRPFETLPPLVGLIALSALTAVLMLVIFRYTSSQEAVRIAKERVKAHVLEIHLFGENLSLLVRAQKRMLLANLAYLRCSLAPFVVMIAPVVLILVQANLRYSHRPLHPGESAVVSVKLLPDAPREAVLLGLSSPDGIVVETAPLHMEWDGEVHWRIRAEKPGRYTLGIEGSGFSVQKAVVVSNRVVAVSVVRVASPFLDTLLNPAEQPLSDKTPIRYITVHYPRRTFTLLGRRVHWLVIFFVLSIAFAHALKAPLRTEV